MTLLNDPRVRFNWGYHDAVQAYRKGWDSGGFADTFHKGRVMTDTIVEAEHHDKTYAAGWGYGYRLCRLLDGQVSHSSEDAWNLFQKEVKSPS